MPDYASILRRSVESVADHTPDMRRAIYERARATIARQLTSVDPPLPAEQIETQHQQLEQAIAEIEAEYSFADFDSAEFEAEIGLNEPEAEQDAGFEYADEEEREQVYSQTEALIDYGTPPPGLAGSSVPVDVRPSNAPLMIVLGLMLLAAVGATVLGYRYQDQVVAFVDGLMAPADTIAESQAPASEGDGAPAPEMAQGEEETVIAKSEERIGGGAGDRDDTIDVLRGSEPGDVIRPQQVGTDASQSETAPDSVVVLREPETAPGPDLTGSDTAGSDTAGPDTTAGLVGSGLAGQPSASPMEPAITGAAGVPGADVSTDRVGIDTQKAIFYTQGEEDRPGQASEGVVTWSRIEQPDGLPAIQAKIDLTDPDVDVVITISRNTDQELPASHLIEVTFDGVTKLTGTELDRIPGLVLKPNEQSRGQPLVGAGVPVTDSIFWIALSDEAEQVKSNVAILREGTWFDMPLLFKDQQRALITFEKGGPGEMLFKEVFAAWDAS